MSGAAPPSPSRWTSRALLLLGGGAVLAALAVALRSPAPLFLALPLLIAPFAAAATGPGNGARADLTWHAGGLGPELEVAGEVRGELGEEVADLVVPLAPPFGAGERRPLRCLRDAGGLRFSAAWTVPRPSVTTIAAPPVVWRDPIGVCERELDGDRPELVIERYPAELRRVGAVRLDQTILLPGETRSRRIGPSGEFFGIREAAPDEPPRRINWRASARVGRLLANDFLLDRTGDLLIVLDVRPTSAGLELDEQLLEVARAAIYGIAESFLRGKVRIGFASFGEFVEPVPIASGRAHRLRLLRAVLASRRAEVAGPAARCANGLGRYYRPGVTALVVSSWTGDPASDLVPYVRRRGFPVILLSPSDLPLRVPARGPADPDLALERRLLLLERQVRLAELWRYGPVIDWDDYWSLDGLVRFLRQPARRRTA